MILKLADFVSEDQSQQGTNWFEFCDNQPLDGGDLTGKSFTQSQYYWAIMSLLSGATFGEALFSAGGIAAFASRMIYLCVGYLADAGGIWAQMATTIVDSMTVGAEATITYGFAAVAILACGAYALYCMVNMCEDDTYGIKEW